MSYMGSHDSISHRVARKLEEELLATGQEKVAFVAYEAISDIRMSEDEIRKLAGQTTRYMEETLQSVDAGNQIHDPYLDRSGVDLKMAIAKRESAYRLLVAVLGQERVQWLRDDTKAAYEAEGAAQ